jgi:2-phosphosulfolactate phosphatase
MTFNQSEYPVRFEWGLPGLEQLAPISDVVIIVDVLSFSTAVDIAVTNGAVILPYPSRDESARAYASRKAAELAAPHRSEAGFSLSPSSLQTIPKGHRLVLPSPNGAALAFQASGTRTFTACLRNSSALSRFVSHLGSTFAVIAAGERWPDAELRPCLEDLLGAGAVLSYLPGQKSPEAEAAIAAFERTERNLPSALSRCSSGKELIEREFARDVELAAELDVSRSIPWLHDGAFLDRSAHTSQAPSAL